MVESICFLKPVWCGETSCRPPAGTGLTARYKSHRLLNPSQVRSSSDLMGAFAEAFRHIVGAPYKLDNLVSAQPAFDVKPHVDEIWIVVYDNDMLGDVTIQTPNGMKQADYAQDRHPIQDVRDSAWGTLWTMAKRHPQFKR